MGISAGKLLIILAIVLLIFGSKRVRSLGADLAGAIKGFRAGLNDDEQLYEPKKPNHQGVISAGMRKDSD